MKSTRANGKIGQINLHQSVFPPKRPFPQTQKSHPLGGFFTLFNVWQFPTLTWGDPTLPSALRRFTS
ncbi:hypothetical protein, partial [Providencia sp.]|uniref:hypothetical protein n=1 Tax=Providencia sp. TaxID=589 RepID=UPI001B46F2CE